jgi:hypothetical protein
MILLFLLGIRQLFALLAFGLIAFSIAAILGGLIRQATSRSHGQGESSLRAAVGLYQGSFGARLCGGDGGH